MKKIILLLFLFLVQGGFVASSYSGQPEQKEVVKMEGNNLIIYQIISLKIEKKRFLNIFSPEALALVTQITQTPEINLKKIYMLAEGKAEKILFSQKLEKIIFGFPLKYKLRNNYLFLNKRTGRIEKRIEIGEEDASILTLMAVLSILSPGVFIFMYYLHCKDYYCKQNQIIWLCCLLLVGALLSALFGLFGGVISLVVPLFLGAVLGYVAEFYLKELNGILFGVYMTLFIYLPISFLVEKIGWQNAMATQYLLMLLLICVIAIALAQFIKKRK